jgi:hypothetical protein
VSNLKLVPDDPTPLEKMLLDASRAELPSEDHKARLRAALGIGVPLSGPLAAPAPAPAAAPVTQAAASLAPPGAAVAKSATAAKVAVGLGILAVAGALWLTRERDTAPVPPPPVVTPVAPVAAAPAPVLAAEPAAVSPLPPVQETTAAPRGRINAAPTSSAPEDLSEQIRLIEAARAGVASRDSKAALEALDSYSAKFSRGSFGQEAMVLRIRALDQAGDFARATALAKSFVTRFPKSPHVARLKPIAERGASR